MERLDNAPDEVAEDGKQEDQRLPSRVALTTNVPSCGMALRMHVSVEDSRELAYQLRTPKKVEDRETVEKILRFIAAQPFEVAFHHMDPPREDPGRIVVPGR